MIKERKIQIVVKTVSYKEAEENDDLYFSKLTAEELLNECFALRKLNYFGNSKNGLPKIKKVAKTFLKNNYEKNKS